MATTSERPSLTVPWRREQVSNRTLGMVRAVLIALSIGVVLLFAIGAARYYHQLLTPCPSDGYCDYWMRADVPGIAPQFYARWSIGRDVIFLSVFCALGALLFWRAPFQPMALLGAVAMIFFGAAVIPEELSVLGLTDGPIRIPAALAEAAGGTLFIIFVLLFPDGRFVPRWTRWLIPAWAVLNVVSSFLPPEHLLGSDGPLATLILLLVLLVCVGALIYRFRKAPDPIERQQLKWVAFGTATAVVGLVIGAGMLPLIPSSVIENRQLFALAGITFTWSILLLIPLSLALALLRYRLWDVDRIARRAVLSGTLIAIVSVIYAAIVLGASALIPSGANRLWPLVAAVVVALLLQPVRGRLERSVNRLFYGQRDDPYTVISGLGERLEGSLSQQTALPTIVETIASELRLPYVAIALAQDGRLQIVAHEGEPGREQVAFSLVSGMETIGELVVSPRDDADTFAASDRRLLADIARQAGAVAEAVRLADRLERANQHLLSVRAEERYRIRRDLHDGLGPLLASQMLILDSARTLMPSDPALAGELLDQLHQHIHTAVDDVRRLVSSLRPATLDELGLTAALRESTADLQRAGLRITIDAPPDLPALAPVTETAAYRIGMEGVTNVVRHAHARECRVALSLEPERSLRLTIRDDGVGMPHDAPTGVGLASMRERVRELGGTFEVQSLPGSGTTLTALLPIEGIPA